MFGVHQFDAILPPGTGSILAIAVLLLLLSLLLLYFCNIIINNNPNNNNNKGLYTKSCPIEKWSLRSTEVIIIIIIIIIIISL